MQPVSNETVTQSGKNLNIPRCRLETSQRRFPYKEGLKSAMD